MSIIRIEEPSDPRLAPYFNLRSGQTSPESFIVESVRLVERLLDSRFSTKSLLVTESKVDAVLDRVEDDVPVYVVSKSHLRETVGFDLHRGCLAHAAAPKLDLEYHLSAHKPSLVVLLEGLADPANVGAIIRNAAAFGAQLVIADPKGASPYTRKATRASAGQIFNVPVTLCEPMKAVELLREFLDSVQVIAATGRRGTASLQDVQISTLHNVLVIGNEGSGITEELRGKSDVSGRIPIAEHVDSLNAAAASAVALHMIGARMAD